MAAVTPTRTTSFEVGSSALAPSTRGPATPAGTTHLVDGWESVCGGGRVRFVFPGRDVEGAVTCTDCADVASGAAVVAATPRQRAPRRTTTAARPAARSAAKAT